MVGDDLLGAYLRRHIEGYLLVEPRCHDHTGLLVFDVAERAGDDIAHAVDEPYIECSAVSEVYADSLLGDELGLGGHNGLACGGLGKLVEGSLTHIFAVYIGYHQRLHEPFYECGFARADGSHHAYVDIAACALGDIAVYIFSHTNTPFMKQLVSAAYRPFQAVLLQGRSPR